MRPRILSVLLIIAAVILGTSLRADIPSPRHVVMISVDGMKPSVYMQPGPSRVPTLRRLMARGAYAEVIGVLPTVTYPSHTTMITGVLPAVHGIYNNYVLDPEGLSNGSWYCYARDIKAPTLHGLMKARGLRTAGVFWPVSVGADIDYLLPEFAVTPHPKSVDLMRALSNPRSLIDAYETSTGAALPWPMTDRERTALTAWILRTYRPHLTLLHIFDTDTAEHNFGPDTPEALASFEAADANIKILVDTIDAAGMADRTDIVIVSDHGFLPVSRQVQVNAVFKREGLLETDGLGKISRWDAYLSGHWRPRLRLPEAAGRRRAPGPRREAPRKHHRRSGQRRRSLFDRAALDQAGADPRASFALDFKAGFQSGSGTDMVVTTGGAKGTHGFAPTRPELHASLIMAGPDVPKAGSLGTVRMTQIGPTIASWFGLILSPEADAPLKLGGGTR